VLVRKGETVIQEDIVLTEIDIENLIRTKAAIYAGCKVCWRASGWAFTTVQQMIIAGGFDVISISEKAIFIGLLPELEIEKIYLRRERIPVGGTPSLLLQGSLKEAERHRPDDDHLELSNHPTFMNEFTAAMFLPPHGCLCFPCRDGGPPPHEKGRWFRGEG